MMQWCTACCAEHERARVYAQYHEARARMRHRHPACVAVLEMTDTPVVVHALQGTLQAVDVYLSSATSWLSLMRDAAEDMRGDSGVAFAVHAYDSRGARVRGSVVPVVDAAHDPRACALRTTD